MQKEVLLYTDGACSGNPGPGGWGCILKYGEHVLELHGGEKSTTNNRMELLGVISGLKALKEPCAVSVCTDSAYVANAFNQHWIDNWQRNGWKKRSKEPVLNRELWEELLQLTSVHSVTFVKVKGHSDDDLNNRCDALARLGAREASAG